MRFLSNLLISAGSVTVFLSACCIDSAGAYGRAAAIACAAGALAAGSGYLIMWIADRIRAKRASEFWSAGHGTVSDFEYIDI